ncbi:MAG: RidA family protein [Ilumatobacteraceae bacterium]
MTVSGAIGVCSGQIGVADGQLVKGVIPQLRQALRNVDAVLAMAGASLDDVFKVTLYLTDIGHYSAVNEEYVEWFPQHPPARTAVQVSGLPMGAAVEVEAWFRSTARSAM